MPQATQDPAGYGPGFGYGAITRSGRTFQTVLLPEPSPHVAVLQPQPDTAGWFGLLPVRSPLLRESLLISFPAGTLDVSVPRVRPAGLWIHTGGDRE